MVACWALLLTSYSVSTNAQQIVDAGTTGNLINFGTSPTATTGTWQNVGQMGGSLNCWAPGQPGYCGPQPYVNANGQGMINFSYGLTDLHQNINVAAAINQTGADTTGLYVTGFNFGFRAKNGNGWDNGQQDYLAAYVRFLNGSGGVVSNYDYSNYTNQRYNWTDFNFTETFTNPAQISAIQTARVGFVGRDTNGWAGPYGPEVYNVNFALRYGYNPCVQNPAYSVDCPGFKTVVESTNLVPNPDAYGVFGSGINNSFAINKAFENAGVGMQIHGFKWGYVANANGPYCNSWDMGIFGCWDFRIPSVRTNVNITDNLNRTIYSVDRTYTNSYNTTNYQYLFPASRPLASLGSFNFSATTNDVAYVGQSWVKALYTPDQCMLNPLSSPTCPGYAKAIATQTVTTAPTSTTTTTTTTTTVDAPVTTTTAPVTSTASTSTALTTNPVASVDPAQPVATTTTTTSSSSTTSTPTTTQATAPTTTVTPTATNPQPKVGEVTTAGSQPTASKSSSGPSTSQILSSVRAEQSRINALETTTAMAAVEQAQQAGTKATNDAQSVATAQQTQSMANAQTVATSAFQAGQTGSQTSSGVGLNLFSIQSSGIGIGFGRGPEVYSLSNNQIANNSTTSFTSAVPTAVAMVRRDREENKAFEQNSAFEQRQSLSATNPLTTVMNPPVLPPPMPPAPTGPSVNAKTKDNDAAGGVSLASIAKQPQGFELYMGGMTDRPFYAPKEIYKGQRVVDNARAQRLLSGASDRLHQEMVDMQYNNKGN